VSEKTTMMGPDGRPSFSMTNEVVEISPADLDASIFDVPAGYREVDDFSASSLAGSPSGASTTGAPSNGRYQENPSSPAPAPAPPAAAPRRDPVQRVTSIFGRRP
jgi:hypothetical protein